MRDPERDCAKFDPVLRAKELFLALDINGDGGVSEEEFIRLLVQIYVLSFLCSGCMRDEAFVLLLQRFSGEDIWGVTR